MSYDHTRRPTQIGLENALAECQRENVILREEQNRMDNQLRSFYATKQKLVKENQILLDENRELSDLCLYLDDERIRLSKLVEDWEKCGKYYCDKISSDISMCQEKLKKLEALENSLLRNKESTEGPTFSMGVADILRRGGDGSSSPSPSIDADPQPNAISILPSALLSPPISDSDESLGRQNSELKPLSFHQFKSKKSVPVNIGKKQWSQYFQDVTNDTSRSAGTHRLEIENEGSGKGISAMRPHSDRSSSLNRSEPRVQIPPSTQVVYNHPFRKTPSTPSLHAFNTSNQLQLKQPPLKNITHQIPLPFQSSTSPSPSSSLSYSQHFKPRPSSAIPPSIHSNMIGYYPLNDDKQHQQMPNRRPRDKEPPTRKDYSEGSYNYKTSF